jgi:hypothetical protein
VAEPSRHFPARTSEALARFCLSCAATVACWCVWLVLGTTLAVQVYVLVARELPLPGFVRDQLESRLAAENFSLTFARAQFDPAGRLLLEDARLHLSQYEDALVVAESVFLRKSPWSLLSGARAPDEVRIQHATIRLPAPLSPSGTAEPLLRDVHAALRLDGPVVHVDHLSFRCGPVAVSVAGEFALPARGVGRPPVGETVARLLRVAREAVRELPRLDCLERPTLRIVLAARPGVGNVADLELSAGGVRHPLGSSLELGPLTATTSLRLDGDGLRPVRVALAATSLAQDGVFAARSVEVRVATQVGLRPWAAPEDFVLEASARELTSWGERAEAPVATARWRSDGSVSAAVAAVVRDSVLVASGTANPARRTGSLSFRGAVPPALVDSVLTPRTPRLARYLRFSEPVDVEAEMEFSEGWSFAGLRSRVRGGALDSNGVAFTALRGRIDVDADGNFLAHDAHVQAGGNRAAGSYWMNFRTMDYRMLLTGALQPPHIAPWFLSGWWSRFWEDIRFPGEAPRADVDVRGNWRDPDSTTYFGWTEAGPAIVRGADFERARVRVFVRPQFAHAFDLEVSRAAGAEWARGWFKRGADSATRSLRRLDYDLAGRLSPGILQALGGEPAEELLAPWSFGTPPQIAFQGRTEYRTGRADPEATFQGEATGPLTYAGFPVDRVRAAGGVRGGDVRIDSLEIEVAGGKGTAKASLSGTGDGRRLGFDFYLDGADLVRGIRALQTYESNRAKGEVQASPNAELLKRASGGRLNFALSAHGHPERLTSFGGSGNLEVKGAELGEVHLFGLLSQVLSGLSLNFSSLKLDTLRGSFRLGDGRVHFPDIRVTGPTALIDGKGDFLLEGRTLDFTAGFKPYEGNRNLITGVIGIVVNPLASILELRLTGPVSRPKWTVSLGGAPARDPAPAAPVPAANPAGADQGRPTDAGTTPKASGD